MKRRQTLFVILIILFLTTIPYLLPGLAGNKEGVFLGFLLNPTDGHSYLAKMREGWQGSWSFHLAFTPLQGHGAPLFLFYIFLGHVARWTGLSLLFVFHAARVVCSILFLLALRNFIDWVFLDQPKWGDRAFLWLGVGSGMGWVLIPFGIITSDFWVSEAYPFLSCFENPHFPLGMALVLTILLAVWSWRGKDRFLWVGLCGLLLSVVMPFGVVLVGVLLTSLMIWDWAQKQALHWQAELVYFLASFPFLLLQYGYTLTDPLLSSWNKQNLTPSPAWWDIMIALSPAIWLAGYGLVGLWNQREKIALRTIVVWLVGGMILIYFPFSLQRRFLFSYFIPVVLAAIYGLQALEKRLKKGWILALGLSLPTVLMVLLIAIFGVLTQNPVYFLSLDEQGSMDWLNSPTTTGRVVLASPEISLIIPGATGLRVVYGHPFETPDAAEAKQAVLDFYSGKMDARTAQTWLEIQKVDYVVLGQKEKKLGQSNWFSGKLAIWESGTSQIFTTR